MESSMSLMLFFEVPPPLNCVIWKTMYTLSWFMFFLTLLFTFWQKYKSCTSTSGSIISYQVRCKCVTLWQVGLFWSQNVFNYVMLGCLVSGLCYLFICPLNSNRMPISYEMKTSLFQNCVSRKNGDIIDFCVCAIIRRIGKRVMEMSR